MKKLLFNLVKILILGSLLNSCSEEYDEYEKIVRDKFNRYQELVNKTQSCGNVDVVFFGDSHTQFGNFENRFSGKCLNLGIGGDTINNLRNRIFMVEKVSPKKIFICVGINDLILGCSYENVSIRYKDFIIELKNEFHDSEIFLESLIPIPYQTEWGVSNYEVLKLNNFIQSICKDYGMTYIDLFTPYSKDGYLNEIYSRKDGHLCDSAYEIWYELVAEYLE